MQIVEFNKKKWIIDLDWEIIPEDDETSRKDIIKNIANKTNFSYGTFIEFETQEAIGLAKKNSKIPSASLFLAIANQEYRTTTNNIDGYVDWIVIEEVAEEKYWMAIIKDGIPAPQSDKVLDITGVKEKISDLIVYNDTYQVFSPCGEIRNIFEDIKYIENKSINDLTANVVAKNKFVKLKGIPNVVIYSGITFIALIGIGLGVDAFLESVAVQQRIQERQRIQAQEQERLENEYRQSLKIYNDEIEKQVKLAENSIIEGLAGTPSKILNSWYEAVGSIQTGMHGWDMSSVMCSFNPMSTDYKSSCIINFDRTGLSTNRMLLQEYPDANIVGNKATVTRGVIADEKIYSLPPSSILKSLPNAKSWGFDMISQLQLLKIVNIDYKIEASQDIMIVPPVKPLSPAEIEQGVQQIPPAPMPIGIAQGDLVINGDSFDLLRELADNVNFEFVGVKSVKFELGQGLGSIPWEITLGYFIKTDNGYLTESDSSGLSNNSVEKNEDEQNNRTF